MSAELAEIPLPDLKVVEEMQLGIVSRFGEIQQAKAAGKPVVWASVVMPKEIFQAMDVAVVYGDMLGAYTSIYGLSARYCQAAEEQGLSRDVCAVHRCAVGMACADERDPIFDMSFAVPDLAVGSNFPCMSMSRSFLQVVRKYDIPYYFLDAPINPWGKDLPRHAVRYYADQLQGLIDFLVAHGHTYDRDKLAEEVAFTKALNAVLEEVNTYKQAVPMPIKAYDNVIASTAPIALPKEHRTLGIFERYRDELKERVERGHGVVENERLRLMWIGMPPLCDFKLLNYPEKHGAVVVKSMLEFLTGFDLDPETLDPEEPLESLARAQLVSPANPTIEQTLDYFTRAAADYRVDGVINVVKRSCGLLPGMQRLTKEAIFEATGVPSMIFDLDGVDVREYDPEATKANLDAFVETLLARKGS
ncbi:MAG: 2-hydroxyacyl-CoA dehydratase [Deltaproteobacteria bacterium]|nr:2-hydroxyacyl-CoA dehydratase [Deltaproteobacteria bacterium]